MDIHSIEKLANSFDTQVVKLGNQGAEKLLKQAILAQELAHISARIARELYEQYAERNE